MFIAAKELHYKRGTNELVAVNINMVIFHRLVLTFHDSDILVVNEVLERIKKLNRELEDEDGEELQENFMKTSDWIVYAILNALAQMFERYVERLTMEGEALDELVLVFNAGEQNDLLRRIGLARRLLYFVRNTLRAKEDIMTIMTTKDYHLITKEIKIYLNDVKDNIMRMDEKISVSKDTLNNLHQTYLARISIEVAEASNQVNGVMKTFSAVATIFIPLNFISSLFGMNVQVPAQNDLPGHDNLDAFYIIITLMGLFVVSCGIFFTARRYW